ncbi:MAG: oligopeptide:H+ symporter [Gammaproteobacteria bacterium]
MSLVVIVGLLLTFVTGIPVARQISRHHPRGLFILFFTELWERFSFYGMRTLLILYLTQHFLFDDAFAARTFGAFTTLAYMLPLLGGLLADRYLGARRAVAFGAVLLVAGHLVMAIEGPPARQALEVGGETYEVKSVVNGDDRQLRVVVGGSAHEIRQTAQGDLVVSGVPADSPLAGSLGKDRYRLIVKERDPLYVQLMFAALSLIALGVGFLKGNVSTLVGTLYGVNDSRRDAGFTLYYFGINLGSFWAAVLCGYLGLRYGWGWGFGLAAAGMLAGLIVFVLGRPLLQGEGEAPASARIRERAVGPLTREHLVYGVSLLAVPLVALLMQRNGIVGIALLLASIGALGYVFYVMYTRHSPQERRRLILALSLVGGSVVFWTLFLQGGTSLNLFADRNTDLAVLHSPVVFSVFGREIFVGTPAMLQAAAPVADARIWIDSDLTSAQVQSFNVAFVLIFAPVFAALWDT